MALDIKKVRTATRNWFTDLLYKLFGKKTSGDTNTPNFLETQNIPQYGEMYLFQYDAKHKDILPVWDQFPLIIFAGPSRKTPENFIGFNLHYLNINKRIQILSALDELQKDNKYDNIMKARFIDYLLNEPRVQVCIKEYIFTHVQGSTYYHIKREAWEAAASIPGQPEWKYGNKPGKAPY